MSAVITTFFEAWALNDDNSRRAKLTASTSPDLQYADPRTPEMLTGIDAINDYIGKFSANAPGWTARVVNTDTTAGVTRATVSFSGTMGPEGKETTQLGQYYVEYTGDVIARMIGFVGTGTPNN